jgi:RNA polymerase sigma-70 factor, ECF subfamily
MEAHVEVEKVLIEKTKTGDLDSFTGLMDLHMNRLRGYIALNVPAAHLVDEVAHETFVFAYHHLSDFEVGTHFFAWLKKIAWNLLRAEIQRYSREQLNRSNYAEVLAFEYAKEKTYEKSSLELEFLEKCMQSVESKLRMVLDMKYRLCCSTQEIAQKLDASEAWVRTSLFRIREQLRRCIESKQNIAPNYERR